MWKLIFVASLLALADGAALVRFINTVPTRTSNPSVNAAGLAASTTGRLTGKPLSLTAATAYPSYNLISDRVGLNYYASSSTGYLAPTVVWTTLLESFEVGTNTAPFYWYHAMPALRAYHALAATDAATETTAIDKPLGTLVAADNFIGVAANSKPVDQWDLYDHTRLRADGVGLYLSFAPGSYRLEAYGVISDATTAAAGGAAPATAPAFTQTPNKFTTSTSTFTFEDNKVYTLIAYGDAAFGATVAYTGANVKLTLLTEDVTSTTFGKAALRFFHGIQNEAANSIDIYNGDIFVANQKIVSGIAFGSVSSYVDVAPSTSVELQVGVPGSTVRAVATGNSVKREVRAGSRLTVICAANDATTKTAFCRGIPSRVVSYVRLVNDVASQNSVVQGKFFPQKLSTTPISLWASYEIPRADQVYEQSQVIGNSVFTNHPATTEGLYPVLSNVAAGKVSGYGEVFVPLPIMDFAIRWTIVSSLDYTDTSTASTDGKTAVKTAGKSPANPITVPLTQFWFAPVHKRVHFLLKTDGGATLTGASHDLRITNPFVFPTTAARGFKAATSSATQTPAASLTVDEYLEPGQYYTIFVYPAKQYSNTASSATLINRYKNTLTTPVTAYQEPAIIRVAIRLDHTMATVATASTTGLTAPITSGKGLLSFVPFFHKEVYTPAARRSPNDITLRAEGVAITKQDWTGGAVSFKQGTTEVLAYAAASMATYGLNRAVIMRSVAGDIVSADAADATNDAATLATAAAQTTATLNGDAAYFSLSAGSYSLTYTLASSTCYTTIPSGQTITVSDQSVTDIFVLNAYGCLEATGTDNTLLSLVTAVRGSASASGHSPFTKRSVESEVAVPLYNSAAINGSSFLLALAALVLAMFAF